jgi:hypothetical protein
MPFQFRSVSKFQYKFKEPLYAQVGLKVAIYGTLPALALQLLSLPAVDVTEALLIVAASIGFSAIVAAVAWYAMFTCDISARQSHASVSCTLYGRIQ